MFLSYNPGFDLFLYVTSLWDFILTWLLKLSCKCCCVRQYINYIIQQTVVCIMRLWWAWLSPGLFLLLFWEMWNRGVASSSCWKEVEISGQFHKLLRLVLQDFFFRTGHNFYISYIHRLVSFDSKKKVWLIATDY